MNVNRSQKRKWFHIKKIRSRLYPAKTKTQADYAYDLTLIGNTTTQAESLPNHRQEQTIKRH